MHIAINEGDGETIKTMIADGASPNSSLMFAWTALTWAIQSEKTEMASVLLEQGAGPNHPNSQGMTPLLIAVGLGSTDGVNALLEHGANVNLRGTSARFFSDLLGREATGNLNASTYAMKKGNVHPHDLIKDKKGGKAPWNNSTYACMHRGSH